MLVSKKLLLIADSKVAKFYSAKGNKVQSLLKGIKSNTWWKLFTRKGHNNFFQRMSVTSHFLDPRHDAKENERKSFSIEIKHTLCKILESYPAEGIIIFADAKMLGELRKTLNSTLNDMVCKEVIKDLTHCTLQEIEGHLKLI